MRRFVICGVSGSTIFSTLSHKRQDLRREVLEFKMCVFWYSPIRLSETLLILRRIERDYHKWAYCRSTYKVIVIVTIFSLNLNFLSRISKNTHISNFMKIRWVGVELFQADGWTDRHDEANRLFRNFANMPITRVFLISLKLNGIIPHIHQSLAIRKM